MQLESNPVGNLDDVDLIHLVELRRRNRDNALTAVARANNLETRASVELIVAEQEARRRGLS